MSFTRTDVILASLGSSFSVEDKVAVARQLNETPLAIRQYNGAVNGLFTRCVTPSDYDQWGVSPRQDYWQFNFCVIDDFGNLVPSDPFYHGSETEQIDNDLSNWLNGWYGAKFSLRRYELCFSWSGFQKQPPDVLIIDAKLNIGYIEATEADPSYYSFVVTKEGPYGRSEKQQVYAGEEVERQGFFFFIG